MSSPRSTLLVALAAGFTVALSRWTPIYDPDCFWHLHTGRYIASRGVIPWSDVFSHTARGMPWRFVDVAADLLLYAAWVPAGAVSLVAFTALLGAAAVALSVHTQSRALPDDAPRLPALVAVAPWVITAVAFRLTPRPQTFTFVALSALVALVVKSRSDPRALWAAPLVTAAWQCLHPSGPLAVLVLGAVAVAATIEHTRGATGSPWRIAWAATALSVPALLACPHPVDRLREGITHVADARLAALVTEWRPAWTHSPASPPVAAVIVLALMALANLLAPREKRPPLGWSLVAAGVTLLGVRAVRFLPLAALALAPVAAMGMQAVTRRVGIRYGVALAVVLALGGATALRAERKPFGHGIQEAVFPIGAAGFVARTHPPGRLVHDFEMGGYLMWTLGDAHPVFVDGRSWALYPTGFLLDAMQLTGDRLERVVRERDLGIAVLRTEARVGRLQARGWQLVYLDDTASVLVRQPPDAQYSARYGYRELRPALWYEDIPRLANDPAALARARPEADRVVREAPSAAFAWVLRGAVLTAAGDEAGADDAARRALELRPDLIAPHRLAMLRCDLHDHRGCACREALRVRERAPNNPQARAVIARRRCD